MKEYHLVPHFEGTGIHQAGHNTVHPANKHYNMNIYVSNLGINVQNEHLEKYFSKYGKVSSVNIVTDKVTQRSSGFAFIYMRDSRDAEKAIRELDGIVLDGCTIKVIESRRKPE